MGVGIGVAAGAGGWVAVGAGLWVGVGVESSPQAIMNNVNTASRASNTGSRHHEYRFSSLITHLQRALS